MRKIMFILSSVSYKLFGKFIYRYESYLRTKENNKNNKTYNLEKVFRELEPHLLQIGYPSNEFNKAMGMILSDINNFEYIAERFRYDRRLLGYIHHDDTVFRSLNPESRSYPMHPLERGNLKAIRVDVQSLFMFSTILVTRSLYLLKMYLPDRGLDPSKDMYRNIGSLYGELVTTRTLSTLGQEFKDKHFLQVKWLYTVLNFYRNKFIEHLDESYQQGMNSSVYGNDFSLSSYKWDYNNADNIRVEKFREKLIKEGVRIPGRSDGGRNLINRFYIQQLFENILNVPDHLLKEAHALIEEIGVHSPQPEKLIHEIEQYIEGIFRFMIENLNKSELEKYKKT